jgi:hypothetical protein
MLEDETGQGISFSQSHKELGLAWEHVMLSWASGCKLDT